MIGLELDRAELDRRLAERFELQLATGFLEEVRTLATRPAGLSRTARQAIGYRELLASRRGGSPARAGKGGIAAPAAGLRPSPGGVVQARSARRCGSAPIDPDLAESVRARLGDTAAGVGPCDTVERAGRSSSTRPRERLPRRPRRPALRRGSRRPGRRLRAGHRLRIVAGGSRSRRRAVPCALRPSHRRRSRRPARAAARRLRRRRRDGAAQRRRGPGGDEWQRVALPCARARRSRARGRARGRRRDRRRHRAAPSCGRQGPGAADVAVEMGRVASRPRPPSPTRAPGLDGTAVARLVRGRRQPASRACWRPRSKASTSPRSARAREAPSRRPERRDRDAGPSRSWQRRARPRSSGSGGAGLEHARLRDVGIARCGRQRRGRRSLHAAGISAAPGPSAQSGRHGGGRPSRATTPSLRWPSSPARSIGSRGSRSTRRSRKRRGARGRVVRSATTTLIDRRFREKIVLVGMVAWPRTVEEVEASLDELALLVDTAGADEAARVVQRREAPDPATYIGRGKAEELRRISEAVDADTVVFDDELTPAQQRNLEKILGRTAIDRTAVILDIFAQNARTQEGRAQVELALSRYRLPRLRGKGVALSQQAGGIGTRGPGRDPARGRPAADHAAHPQARGRAPRARGDAAGPSGAGREAGSACGPCRSSATPTPASRRCSTSSPTPACSSRTGSSPRSIPRTRRLELPGGEAVLCSDTVGFVRKLPHQLVDAFHATLEVVGSSDLLVHVVDASAADPDGTDRGRSDRARRDRGRRRARAAGVQQGGPRPAQGGAADGLPSRARWPARPSRAGACPSCSAPSPTSSGPPTARWSSRCRSPAATSSRPSTARARCVGERYEGEHVLVQARLDERGARRYAEFVQP